MERVITIKRRRPAEGDQGETYKLYMSPRMEILRIPFEASDDSLFSVVSDWVAMAKRHGDAVVLLLGEGAPSFILFVRGEPTITKFLWLNKDGTREHVLNESEELVVRVIREKGGSATTGELMRDPRIARRLVDVVDILLPLGNSGVMEWEYFSGPSDNLHGRVRLLEP